MAVSFLKAVFINGKERVEVGVEDLPQRGFSGVAGFVLGCGGMSRSLDKQDGSDNIGEIAVRLKNKGMFEYYKTPEITDCIKADALQIRLRQNYREAV